MLGFVIKLACFDTCPKLSESKTVFNIFGSKIKEWWDRDQLLEDQVEPLIFVWSLISLMMNVSFFHPLYYTVQLSSNWLQIDVDIVTLIRRWSSFWHLGIDLADK
jgi:hypothetical protein